MSDEEIDPLDGFRAEEERDLSEGEAALLKALMDNRGLLEVINVGIDMERFRTGPAGKAIWADAEQKLAESIQHWLTTDDPTTPQSKNAHFNARVAIGVLKSFQEHIDAGRETALHMRQSNDEQDSSR